MWIIYSFTPKNTTLKTRKAAGITPTASLDSGVENSPLNGICDGLTAQVLSICGEISAGGESIVQETPLGREFATAKKERLLPTICVFFEQKESRSCSSLHGRPVAVVTEF